MGCAPEWGYVIVVYPVSSSRWSVRSTRSGPRTLPAEDDLVCTTCERTSLANLWVYVYLLTSVQLEIFDAWRKARRSYIRARPPAYIQGGLVPAPNVPAAAAAAGTVVVIVNAVV